MLATKRLISVAVKANLSDMLYGRDKAYNKENS